MKALHRALVLAGAALFVAAPLTVIAQNIDVSPSPPGANPSAAGSGSGSGSTSTNVNRNTNSKDGGWQKFGFENQGQCVSATNQEGKNRNSR